MNKLTIKNNYYENLNNKDIKIFKQTFIYGENGTGKSTTAASYLNREDEGIFVFTNEYVNQNLFEPSEINAIANTEQENNFVEVLFGHELATIGNRIKLIDSEKSSFSPNKEKIINKDEIIKTGIKSEMIEDKDLNLNYLINSTVDTLKFKSGDDIFDSEKLEFGDVKKLANDFLIEKLNGSNLKAEILNRDLHKNSEIIKMFDKKNYTLVIDVNKEMTKINSYSDLLNDEIISIKNSGMSILDSDIPSEILPFVQEALKHSEEKCILCGNEEFNKESKEYKMWIKKIENIVNTQIKLIKTSCDKIIEKIKTLMVVHTAMPSSILGQDQYITFSENLKSTLIGIEEIVELIKDPGTFVIKEILNLETFSLSEAGTIHHNCKYTLINDFYKEEYIEYLIVKFKRDVLQKESVLTRNELDGFDADSSVSAELLRSILSRLGYDGVLQFSDKKTGQKSKLGISRQAIDLDDRKTNELSSGERNILALAFFLTSLHKNKDNIKTIIFDDPMDSNDSGKISLFIDELYFLDHKIKNKEYQSIHLTHNSEYLFACVLTNKNIKNGDTAVYTLSKNYSEPKIIENLEKFLISDQEFLRNIVDSFISENTKETFLRVVCIIEKYQYLLSETLGIKAIYGHRKLLDYKKIQNGGQLKFEDKKSETYLTKDFVNFYNYFNKQEININDFDNFEVDIEEIRSLYMELDDWKEKETFEEDINEKTIRIIALATYQKKDDINIERTNKIIIRHSGSMYKPILHMNNLKI